MAQHARKNAALQVVTANSLKSGHVVYLRPDGKWGYYLEEAAVAETPQQVEALLAQAAEAQERQEIVEAYAFEVKREAGKLVPVSVREKIRMAGPTTRPDLGKQARKAKQCNVSL